VFLCANNVPKNLALYLSLIELEEEEEEEEEEVVVQNIIEDKKSAPHFFIT